jgi:hypothetical protein
MRVLRLSLVGTVTLSLIGGLGSVVMAQDATDQAVEPDSILFVGNSFTENLGGVENHVSALAASENPPREIVAAARTMGGATLKTHHQQSDPNPVFGAVAAINARATMTSSCSRTTSPSTSSTRCPRSSRRRADSISWSGAPEARRSSS